MKNTLLIFTLLALLSGCAGKHLMTSDGKCLTCFNNPITGEGINHEGSYATQTNSKSSDSKVIEVAKSQNPNGKKCVRTKADSPFHCDPRLKMPRTSGSFSVQVPVDVDLAYTRIKRKFNYRTHEELKAEYKSLYNVKASSNTYKYNSIPGSSYTMKRDFSDFKYSGDPLFTVIEMYLEKNGKNSSYIEFSYTYADPNLSKLDFQKDLELQVKQALRI